MTIDQRNMLFRMFASHCAAAGITGAIARDQERERITVKVFGKRISWSTFKNPEVDKMKGELLALLKPADLNAQVKQILMPRTRLLYAIRHTADAPYVAKIALDKFATSDLELLSDEQLDQLRITLHNRCRNRNKKPARNTIIFDEVVELEPEHTEEMEIPF